MKQFKKAGSLLFQIITLLVLFTAAFLLLARANLIQLPGFMQSFFHDEPEIKTETINKEHDIREFISDAPENSDGFKNYPTISADKMNTLLNSLIPLENFYWETVSEIYSDDSVKISKCRSRISGNRYAIDMLDNNDNFEKKIVSDGEKTNVTSYTGGTTNVSTYNTGIFDFYSDAGLVSIKRIKDSAFTAENCEIRHIDDQQYKLISVVFTYERNGITIKNDYGISLDYGVVLFAQEYENDILTLKQTTTSIYPLTPRDDMFTLN